MSVSNVTLETESIYTKRSRISIDGWWWQMDAYCRVASSSSNRRKSRSISIIVITNSNCQSQPIKINDRPVWSEEHHDRHIIIITIISKIIIKSSWLLLSETDSKYVFNCCEELDTWKTLKGPIAVVARAVASSSNVDHWMNKKHISSIVIIMIRNRFKILDQD